MLTVLIRRQIQKKSEIFNCKEELENKGIAGGKKRKKKSFLYVFIVCVYTALQP